MLQAFIGTSTGVQSGSYFSATLGATAVNLHPGCTLNIHHHHTESILKSIHVVNNVPFKMGWGVTKWELIAMNITMLLKLCVCAVECLFHLVNHIIAREFINV